MDGELDQPYTWNQMQALKWPEDQCADCKGPMKVGSWHEQQVMTGPGPRLFVPTMLKCADPNCLQG